MRRFSVLCLVVTVLVASCGPGAEPTSSVTTASPGAPTTTTALPTPDVTSSMMTSTVPERDEHDYRVLVAGQDGIWLVGAGTPPAQLLAHRASYAVDDRRGGVLFQIDRGRRAHDGAWSTIVWWVPAGSASPRELLVPTPGSAHGLWLHDAFELEGHLNVLYTRSEGFGLPGAVDTLRRYDVEARAVHELYSQTGWEAHFDEVAEAEGSVLFTVHSMFGRESVARSLDGDPVTIPALPETPAACHADVDKQPELWCPASCVMSDDGTQLACASSLHNTWPSDTRVTVLTIDGRDLATVTIAADAERNIAELDIHGRTLVVNRKHHDGTHAEALMVDLDDPGGLTPRPLPVAGLARLVRASLDVGAPITFPAPSHVDTVVIADGFESYPVGTYPSDGGWYVEWSGREAYVSDAYAYSGRQSFRLSGFGGWVRTDALAIDLSAATSLAYELAVYCPLGDMNCAEVGFFVRTAPNESWAFNSFHFTEGHGISVTGTGWRIGGPPGSGEMPTSATWEHDTWYVVRAEIDYTTDTVTFWLDDVLLMADVPAAPADASSIFSLANRYGVNDGLVYFDDVTIETVNSAS